MLIQFCLSALAATASMGSAVLGTMPTDTQPETPRGTLAVRLTSARLVFVTVQAVNLFVVRVEARRLGSMLERDEDGWVTLAQPNAIVDFMTIQDGLTALLGMTAVDTGRYVALRIIVDPSKSSLALKDGRTLPVAQHAEPGAAGPRAIDAELRNEVDVRSGAITAVTLEVRVGDTFSLRGSSSVREGLTFNPSASAECTHERLSLFGEPRWTAARRYVTNPLR